MLARFLRLDTVSPGDGFTALHESDAGSVRPQRG
jgi:hypothetical protein